MDTLGIGILTMNQPKNLENILNSYKKNKFLDNCNEKIILLQENNPKEGIIAENFGLTIYSTKNNIGIGPGNNFLINKLSSKYFIILQNDFELISDDYKNEIEKGIKLINSNKINCYRLRNLENPGVPCHGSKRNIEKLDKEHYSELLYYNYLLDAEIKYPEIFNKEKDIYILSSKNANYTENPCLYEREWYIKNIYNFNKINGILAESNVQKFWEKQDYKIGMGKGLFKHNDLKN